MKGCLVDTNVFLRLLTADDPKQTPAAKKFFTKVIHEKSPAYVTVVVLLELVWTLESYYKLARPEIAEKIALISNTPNLVVENQDVVDMAIEHYGGAKTDFADCYNAAFAKLKGDGRVVSYDRDFDKLPGIQRQEP